MTVITEPVVNLAGLADNAPVTFYVGELRRRASGHGIVTPMRVQVIPVSKVLTTPDLNPGPAKVQWGTKSFSITIPDSATPVPLWPLIEAGMQPSAPSVDFVFNGGGIERAEAMSLIEYADTSEDPATMYFLYND